MHQDNLYSETSESAPQLIMTYTALLSLAMLRDDFSRLDRSGLISFLKACQNEDGRYANPIVCAQTRSYDFPIGAVQLFRRALWR